ncbi:MAG: hypothetical protein LBV29_04860 [Azoarcus sp.]|nr:hypothetical protein [Azoarcus sp.]
MAVGSRRGTAGNRPARRIPFRPAADCRGEIKVILHNTHGYEAFPIERGDRIAQLVLAPVVRANVVEVAETSETDRGTAGFGSTGLE